VVELKSDQAPLLGGAQSAREMPMYAVVRNLAFAIVLISLPLVAKSPARAVVECQSAGKATVRLTIDAVTYVVRVDCGLPV
jgi:hypothetical protein